MASSAQFQQTLSKILKNKEDNVKNRIEANTLFIANKVLRLLGNNVNYGKTYVDGEGISPEDQYTRGSSSSIRVIDAWRKYKNNRIKDGVGYIFRNDAKHSPYIFGRKASTGVGRNGRSIENAKYRSAQKHKPVPLGNGKYGTRANQLTAKKWKSFLLYSKKLLEQGALGGITTK